MPKHQEKSSLFNQPVTEIIQTRFSCRGYLDQPLTQDIQHTLRAFCQTLNAGPLGTPLRFELLAATPEDTQALRGLGTYGSIKKPAGFLVGAIQSSPTELLEYGYQLEKAILFATGLGLGSCWLGGAFTRSSFAEKISARPEENLLGVAALGYIPDLERARQAPERRKVRADWRLGWEHLFFDQDFAAPLLPENAEPFTTALEMVRLGPSAHNKQPWRVVKQGSDWHFYLQRTPDTIISLAKTFLKIADLQCMEIGIAMCHFELTAQALGLSGSWIFQEPDIKKPNNQIEYIISWQHLTGR
jgi:nitroreductase